MYLLPSISRNKSEQTMKLSQLIEYKMRNVFLEETYTKCSGETILTLFSRKSNLSISLDQ